MGGGIWRGKQSTLRQKDGLCGSVNAALDTIYVGSRSRGKTSQWVAVGVGTRGHSGKCEAGAGAEKWSVRAGSGYCMQV